MARLNRKKTAKRHSGRRWISCMLIVMTFILSVQIVRLYEKNEDYKAQEAALEEELASEQQRAEELAQEEEYAGSDEYIEDTARSKLGMAYDDEIIFKEE